MSSASAKRDTYCYRCGTVWRELWVVCQHCGGTDRSTGASRPTVIVSESSVKFQGPWRMINWPAPGIVMIFGGPGAGKSSLAAMIRPKAWITSEQAPKPVKPLFDRVAPGHMPVVYPAKTPDHVAHILSQIHEGPLVTDSLSAFGGIAGLTVAKMMQEWAAPHDERALGIVQVTKGGDAAGFMALPHLVDAVVSVAKDVSGMRLFNIEKCRWSPEGSVYWAFGEKGEVIAPDFPAAYSVAGETTLWLQPFPMGRTNWSDLLTLLDKLELLEPGTASAAHWAYYMPHHFLEPRDLPQRRAFAENVGLRWISPAEVWSQIEDALVRKDENADPTDLLRALMK
jgi:hypothetical protein